MLRRLRRAVKTVLFGKRKQYNYKSNNSNYIKNEVHATWHAHIKLQNKVDNLIKHLKLKEVGNTGLIGEPKDAKKFDDQWNN